MPSLPGGRSFARRIAEDVANDPAIDAVHGLFELLAFYALVWGFILGLSAAVFYLVELTPVALTGPFAFALMFVPLLLGIGIFRSFDSPAGKLREQRVKRWARLYGYPIVLGAGILAGWHLRAHFPPDASRAAAERAAWRTCGRMPTCVRLATEANEGNEVESYIGPEAKR